jgi:hypothetical protein
MHLILGPVLVAVVMVAYGVAPVVAAFVQPKLAIPLAAAFHSSACDPAAWGVWQ